MFTKSETFEVSRAGTPKSSMFSRTLSQGREMSEYSDYQRKVIKRYYDNREEGDEQRFAELVSNLYLAEGKKRSKLWEQAETYLTRMRVPPSRISHILQKQDVALLAEIVTEAQKGTLQRVPPPRPESAGGGAG